MNEVLTNRFVNSLSERIKSETWFDLKGFAQTRGVGGPMSLIVLFGDLNDEFSVHIQPTSSSHYNICDEDWDPYRLSKKELRAIRFELLQDTIIKLLESFTVKLE